MLQNLDTSDVTYYGLYAIYIAIWIKLVLEALNPVASTQLYGLAYGFSAWAATTLATLALSAWVTLNVVQVALRNANFKKYGETACNYIGVQICYINFKLCNMCFGQDFRDHPITSVFASGKLGGLDLRIPENMDELIKLLDELLNNTSPDKQGHIDLTSTQKSAILMFCSDMDDWWEMVESKLEIVRFSTPSIETIKRIDTYKHYMEAEIKIIQDVLGERPDDAQGVIGAVSNIAIQNRDFYETMLVEVGAKKDAEYYFPIFEAENAY
jgi:hypothetical protein